MHSVDSRPLLGLRTLCGESGEEMLRGAVEAVRRSTRSDFASFVGLVRCDGRATYGRTVSSGTSDMHETFDALPGQPAMRGGWRVEKPRDSYANSFERLRDSHVSAEEREKLDVWQTLYAPFDVDDQLRTILYDGVRCLGFLAMMVRGRHVRYPRSAPRDLERHVSALRDAVTAAGVVSSPLETDTAFALCRADGSVSHLSAGARGLDADQLRSIERSARQSDRLPVIEQHLVHRRVVRLDDGNATRYVVLLEQPAHPRADPRSLLTARQLEVAESLVEGATMSDVADALGISRHTVKYHLKNIYERLNVASRTELSLALAEGTPHPHG